MEKKKPFINAINDTTDCSKGVLNSAKFGKFLIILSDQISSFYHNRKIKPLMNWNERINGSFASLSMTMVYFRNTIFLTSE